MKNFFKNIKHYSFWVSLSGAIIVLLNAFGNALGFKIDNKVVEDCVMSIASLLVVFGIVSMNKKDKKEDSKSEESAQDTNDLVDKNFDGEATGGNLIDEDNDKN